MGGLFANEYFKVAAGLVIGLAIIIYLNPPHTPCDSQKEIYTESIKPLTKIYTKNAEACRANASAGGCLAIFEIIQKLENHLEDLGPQCQADLKSDDRTKSWLTAAMELFTRLAWGSQPPKSYVTRNGWLEPSQVAFFCKMRKHLSTIYGDEEWHKFFERLLKDLPKAAELGRNEAWARSILSDQCKLNQ